MSEDRTDEDRAGFDPVPDVASLLTVVCKRCGALLPEGAIDLHRRFHALSGIGLA